MKTFLKFLLLVIILNVVRYLVGGPLEALFVVEGMHAVMPQYPEVFNVDFSGRDFALSFFYNFMLWFSATAVFYLSYPAIKGHFVIRSLKVFGLMCLFFVSLAAVYMNHFREAVRAFYIYSMLDAIILFSIVGIANGLIFPLLFRKEIANMNS